MRFYQLAWSFVTNLRMRLLSTLLFTFLGFLPVTLLADEQEARDLLVQAILTEDEDEQVEFIRLMADTGEPIVSEVLESWKRGDVYIHELPDGSMIPIRLGHTTDKTRSPAVAIADNKTLEDASGEPLILDQTTLSYSKMSRPARSEMRRTINYLALASPNPQTRAKAAMDYGLKRTSDNLVLLQDRLAVEKSSEVRESVQEAIAITELELGTPEEKVNAARILGEVKSIAGFDALKAILADEDADPALKAAATKSVQDLEEYLKYSEYAGTVFRGLSLGSILIVVSIGLAITFGLMGVINMAHGEIMAMGAYATFLTQQVFLQIFKDTEMALQYYFIAAIPVAFLASALLGLLLERTVIRFLYNRPLESLLATWGVAMIFQEMFRKIFGPQNVSVNSPTWLMGNVEFFDITFGFNRIFVILFAVIIVIGTWLLLTRTPLGLYIRAVMQNRNMAACMGVKTSRVYMMTFAFGSGLAGLAGAFLSQIGNVGPNLGQDYIVQSFMVVVVGGVGNLFGTVYSATGIGLIDQSLQPWLGPVMGKISVLIMIILFLQFRPSGLFPTRTRSLEG